MSRVCVRRDLAGGAISAEGGTMIGTARVALDGDRVASHAPCPVVPVHCAAVMTTTRRTHINGVPVVVEGDAATCGHTAVASRRVTITRGRPGPPPGEVSVPTVTGVPSALDVSWAAVERAEGYLVQWRSGTQSWDATRQAEVRPGTSTSYQIRDLTPGTEYTVRVQALGVVDNAPPSAEATGTPTSEEATLHAPASSYSQVAGFLVQWQGSFGELPAAWFEAGADRTLRYVRVNGPLLGGTVELDVGVGRQDLLDSVRLDVSLTIDTDVGSVTLSQIGGHDTSEPYEWVPGNADDVAAWFAVASRERSLAATFTFRRASSS